VILINQTEPPCSAFTFDEGESEATQNFSCLYPIAHHTLESVS